MDAALTDQPGEAASPHASPFILRPATPADQAAIRALIRQVHINPLGLHWPRFWLAVDGNGQILACGQVKRHGDGTQELASIATVEKARGQGAASAIIARLVETHPGPLYLTCRPSMGSFYLRFGFRRVTPPTLPPAFQRLWRVAAILYRLRVFNEMMWIMLRE